VIQAAYLAASPITTIEEDAGEIATHGLFEFAVDKPLITDLTIAAAFAVAELAKHLTVLRRVTYTTRERRLTPGQTQALLFPARDVDFVGLLMEVVIESEPGGDLLVRRVTAIEGNAVQGDWREIYRRWIAGG